ncbi:hypothetical protein JCM3770_001125 [Rhodotorula araucariae]
MPWAYAVPLGVGIVAVAAVAVILIEIVPAVLEERSRADRYHLRPISHESHHVLGDTSSVAASDHELGARDDSGDDNVPLSQLSPPRGTFTVGGDAETPPRSRALSDAGSDPGTAPFFSPPLSTSSRIEGDMAEASTGLRKEGDLADPFTDDAASTLFASFPSSSHDPSPALSPTSSFAPFSASQATLKHGSPDSTGGCVLESQTPSTASSGTDEGWTRLSETEEGWSEVRTSAAGLGLAGMATH